MENKSRTQATLVLQNISMYYHSGNNIVPGIVGVNLEFRKGEFVVITGESGSGKSTLLNIISALAPYHDGELYINGEETSAYSEEDWENYRREHIGFVFQEYNLIKSYTVLENVTSAVLLRGMEQAEAKKQAKSYLEQVGLGEMLHRKASKLSSGQKQRLAIARALAKNTDIIVADEPTGNLDSENGKQIVEILSELSKERLVIMVSHNVEEAIGYATRRVRIHASHVVADQKLREDATETASAKDAGAEKDRKEESSKEKARTGSTGTKEGSEVNLWAKEESERRVSERKAAWRLALLNDKAQPVKVLLVTCFMLACTLASGIFAAGYLASADDTKTRIYENGMFLNGDEKRLVVAKEDGTAVDMKDVEFLRTLRYVEHVELYDNVSDINYYNIPDRDYVINYGYLAYTGPWEGPEQPPTKGVKIVSLRNHSKYIRSATCITETDLAAGRLPEAASEIVYGNNEKLIGTTMEIAISDRMRWETSMYAFQTFTIVGVLKEAEEQVYFSEEYCQALIVNGGGGRGASLRVRDVPFSITRIEGDFYSLSSNNGGRLIILPDSNLSEGTVQIADVWLPVGVEVKEGDPVTLCRQVAWNVSQGSLEEEQGWDESVSFEHGIKYVAAKAASEPQISSKRVQLVSPELYYKLFCMTPDLEPLWRYSGQITLYIKDYAYTDDVLRELSANGYMGLNPLRASSLNYDQQKVTEQLTTLFICMAAFIGVYFLEVFILKIFMKFKKGDYQVLHSIGMTQYQMKQMVLSEFMLSAAIAVCITGIAAMAAWFLGGDIVYNLMKYLRWYHYMALVLLEFAAVFVLAASYNGYLRKQFGAASAKESR